MIKDELGNVYGILTVITRSHTNKNGEVYWLCKCNCGREITVSGASLRRGCTKSCGKHMPSKHIDITNTIYGRLTVLEKVGRSKDGALWRCRCSCGNETVVPRHSLVRGRTESCGCLHSDRVKETHTGKEISEYQRQRISECNSGTGHPNWKGGISGKPYCAIFRDDEFRSIIFERDHHECQNPGCKRNGSLLCIHHIDYDKKNCRLDNLITLCISCNSLANYDRDKHILLYKSIINSGVKRNGQI